MPTKLDYINRALLTIGVSRTISDAGEQSREALTGTTHFESTFQEVLRKFPWAFATKYADLVLVRGPAWTGATVQAWSSSRTYVAGDVVDVGGTFYYAILTNSNQTPPNATYWSTTAPLGANDDWLYAYQQPIDCLFARRLVPPVGPGLARRFSSFPLRFRVGRTTSGVDDFLLIYANEQDADLEYTMYVQCDVYLTDVWFDAAVVWLLASKLAPSLSRNGKTAQDCLAMFLETLQIATAVNAVEQQQDRPGQAEWINARQAGPFLDPWGRHGE